MASRPFDAFGMMGGVRLRSNPHEMGANHLCVFTSDAPDWDPMRLISSLMRSLRINDFPKEEMGMPSGKDTSFRRTLENV